MQGNRVCNSTIVSLRESLDGIVIYMRDEARLLESLLRRLAHNVSN